MPPGVEPRTRLLIIDPMPLARKALTEALVGSTVVEVVAASSSVELAERKLATIRPDVILLDVQTPFEAEVDRLRSLREQWPIPLVLFTALNAGDRQAVINTLGVPSSAVLAKPPVNLVQETLALATAIEVAVRRVHRDDLLRWRKRRRLPVISPRPLPSTGRVIAIGASTGGTEAIAEILSRLPRVLPGIVIVQHMPAGFTRLFAERLDEVSELEVREAEDGDEVRPGLALLAPGGLQMALIAAREGFIVRVADGPRVNGHCPSVDVLMNSVARQAGPRGAGVLLTGMGDDGAEGMKAIRDAGGGTIAQDQDSSIVYGMPREAFLRGGAAKVLPLVEIPRHILMFFLGQ